ncbi:MAG TPA: bifunctional diguanylate cyclase/phosphodiesterase [Solirubrobacteraceae bacterium]|jgi:diguanylate cyclase (GGDEF)-like protein
MPNSEIDNGPEPDAAGASAASAPAAVPAQPGEQSAPPSTDGQSTSAEEAPAVGGRLGRVGAIAGARRGVAAAVAVLCVLAGTIAALLGAHAVARTDARNERRAFPQTTASIASTLKLAIQREEELGISASTFFAGNPKASAAELGRWVNWAHTLRRYPELQSLGLAALVRAPELAAFDARIAGHATKQRAARSASSTAAAATAAALRVIPPGARGYYCLTAAELARSAAASTPVGLDYCAATPALLASRDSGKSIYTAARGGLKAVAIETPVYRGNVPPPTFATRRAAFVGWLRTLLTPGVVLRQVLHGHAGYAVRLTHRGSSPAVTAAAGTAAPGAQSATVDLHDGWSMRSVGPVAAAASVLSDGNAVTLLIGGILLSVLLGLIVYLLGGRRPAAASPTPKTRELPHSDLYDALTGLPNQALALDRAGRMVARAGRQSGMLAGALLIDIDWFKDVNEKLGRGAGDQLLSIVARRLEEVIRGEDTVGRIGGDEFVVLVESAARGVRLDSLAGRIIEALHRPVELEGFGPSFFATASIGVAFGRYDTADDLMRDAQLALYSAKAAGKDRYTLFNANMRSMIESRGVLEAELNAALQEQQFFLLYQPIYDLDSRMVAGLEAVIRWQHPKRGVLGPDEFIPLAEETGLIVPIGRWALEQACNRTAAWNVSGHRVGVSVKVTANQLNRDGFETDVRRALQQSGIDPRLLTLEIAEATVMRDVAACARRITEIKRHGVLVALDDFGGSGYARHADLRQVALDALKVDRSSLAAADDDAYRSWLLESILIVGRDLSLAVIATGIENAEQLIALQALGCTMAQGPFIGEPTGADEVKQYFEAALPALPAPASRAGAWGADSQR